MSGRPSDHVADVIEEMISWDYKQGNPSESVVDAWADRLAAPAPVTPTSYAVDEAAEIAADRLDSLVAAMSLPMSADIHLRALRSALPEISDDLRAAIKTPSRDQGEG